MKHFKIQLQSRVDHISEHARVGGNTETLDSVASAKCFAHAPKTIEISQTRTIVVDKTGGSTWSMLLKCKRQCQEQVFHHLATYEGGGGRGGASTSDGHDHPHIILELVAPVKPRI